MHPSTPRFTLIARAGLWAAFALALTGCSLLPKPTPDPTRHYVLSEPTPLAVDATSERGRLKVGVRAVQVAPYLSGKAMIIRRGDNEIDYRDYACWAEPLTAGVNRLLVARILTSERVARVFAQPFPLDTTRDIDVAVTVQRCEGQVTSDGKATVRFLCALEVTRAHEGAGTGEVILRESFDAPPLEWTEGDFAGLAKGLSEAVEKLAERVLAVLPAD